MTEADWLGDEPMPELACLRSIKPNDRKMRLFIVAGCRWRWDLLEEGRCRDAVEVAERFADGAAGEEELKQFEERIFSESARSVVWTTRLPDGSWLSEAIPSRALRCRQAEWAAHSACVLPGLDADGWFHLICDVIDGFPDPGGDEHLYRGGRRRSWLPAPLGGDTTWDDQLDLLHEIVGNPFRPLVVDQGWLTPTVTALAQTAYEERILPSGNLDPARLAVLSDALEEAGCDNADILSHLRGPGPHVRGCWVIDLLLGKT
jgi:hypothetical protein